MVKHGHSGLGGGVIDNSEIKHSVEDAFREAASELKHADFDKQVKVFGLFEMDAGMAGLISTAYNNIVAFGNQYVAPRTFDLVVEHGHRIKLSGAKLTHAAAIATVGVNFALASGKYFGDFFQGLSEQQSSRKRIVQKLSPVLDDLVGKHSVGAFMSIDASKNEVIYAHRKRMTKIANIDNGGHFSDIILNALPSMALQFATQYHHMWKPGVHDEAHRKVISDALRDVKPEGNWLLTGIVGNIGKPLADRVKASGQHKKDKKMEPYSALEMILELEEQMSKDSKAHGYALPKGGSQHPLEEYLVRIFIQHQKDMSAISPEHTKLREALKEDLNAVVAPLAEAMKKGDLSPLSLVRLVGEGKIIKGKGRAIADPDDIKSYIEKHASKTQTYTNVDPKEYYATASFNKEELAELLKKLDKDEKALVASWIPDALLKQAGMKDDEIKQLRTVPIQEYERQLGEAFAGLTAMSDEDLKKEGFANGEIKQIRAAEEKLKQGGVAAVHDLKTNPANERGIERPLVNYAVSHIKGNKQALGTLLSKGKETLASMTDKPANDEGGEKGEKSAPKKFTSRAKQFEQTDHAKDDAPDAVNENHKDREDHRRAKSDDAGHEISA